MTATRAQIVTEARSYIGTPYHHQGRLKGIGVDCAGVVVGINKTFGLTSHDVKGYSQQPHHGLLQQSLCDAGFTKMRLDQLETGDCMLMRFGSEPQHLAVYTGEGTMVHSYSKVGKVVEHNLNDVWKQRITAVYQFPGLIE